MAKTIGKMRAVRANPAPDLTILRLYVKMENTPILGGGMRVRSPSSGFNRKMCPPFCTPARGFLIGGSFMCASYMNEPSFPLYRTTAFLSSKSCKKI